MHKRAQVDKYFRLCLRNSGGKQASKQPICPYFVRSSSLEGRLQNHREVNEAARK